MNRADLQHLAAIRLVESKALFETELYSSAYYLAGYSVECALKAVIALQTQLHDFPDKQRATESHTHDCARLAQIAGIFGDLSARTKQDRLFQNSWAEVSAWSEKSRYLTYGRPRALAIIQAVEDTQSGVLPWIMQYW